MASIVEIKTKDNTYTDAQIDAKLADETTARSSEDASLHSKIDVEIARATAAESVEESRAKAAEGSLQAAIDGLMSTTSTLSTNINSLSTSTSDSLAGLVNMLNSFTTQFTTSLGMLQTAVDNEIATARANEAAAVDLVTKLTARVVLLESSQTRTLACANSGLMNSLLLMITLPFLAQVFAIPFSRLHRVPQQERCVRAGSLAARQPR